MPNLITPAGTHVEQESTSFNPVYVDTNGNLYTITESTLAQNNQPRAMKSTDGGVTWTEMDAANRPGTDTGGIGDLESGWITQEPGYLTFTWARSYAAYSRFRTSDHPTVPDTWEDNDRENVGSGSSAPQFMSHTSPTDRSYQWLFWGSGSNILYRNRPYGADTTESSTQTFQSGAAVPMAWLDDDDITWVVYRSGSQLHYKTLTSGGTLSGATRIDTNGITATPIPHCRPVIYRVGTDKVVTCIFANGSGGLRAVDIVNGTPGSEQTITDDPVMQSAADNDGTLVTADVDGTTMHAFWSDASTGDIMHSQRDFGGSWSAPDAVTDANSVLTTGVWWLYCKTLDFPSGGRGIALRYSDGFDEVNEVNDIYYHLYPLTAVTTVNVNQVTESDTAQGIDPLQPQQVPVGLAIEVDRTFGVDDGKPSELDEALPITATLGIGHVSAAHETDTAQSVQPVKVIAVGLTTETDESLHATRPWNVAIGQALELDESAHVRWLVATDITVIVATSRKGWEVEGARIGSVLVEQSRVSFEVQSARLSFTVGASRIEREPREDV